MLLYSEGVASFLFDTFHSTGWLNVCAYRLLYFCFLFVWLSRATHVKDDEPLAFWVVLTCSFVFLIFIIFLSCTCSCHVSDEHIEMCARRTREICFCIFIFYFVFLYFRYILINTYTIYIAPWRGQFITLVLNNNIIAI